MGLVREIKAAASGHGHGCGCAACRETYFRSGAVDRVLLWRVAAGALLFVAAWATRAGLPAVSLLLAIASVLCAGYDRMICSVARSIRDRPS